MHSVTMSNRVAPHASVISVCTICVYTCASVKVHLMMGVKVHLMMEVKVQLMMEVKVHLMMEVKVQLMIETVPRESRGNAYPSESIVFFAKMMWQ